MAGLEQRQSTESTRIQRQAEEQEETPAAPSMEAARNQVRAESDPNGSPGFFAEVDVDDPVAVAQLRMHGSAADLEVIRARADAGEQGADEAYAAALAARSSEFAGFLDTLSPEDQAVFLAEGGAADAAGMLEAAQANGGTALVESVVANLVRGGESLGQGNVDQLAEALQSVDPAVLLAELPGAIASGHGALLGVALARRDPETFANTIDQVLGAVAGSFRDSSEEMRLLRREMLIVAKRMEGTPGAEGAVEDDEASFQAEHQEAFDRFERDAATYASTLNGLSLAATPEQGDRGPLIRGRFAQDAHERLDLVDELAMSNVGGQAAAEALLRAGRGERTWLDDVRQDPDQHQAALIDHLLNQGAMQGLGALASTGDLDAMSQLLAGLEAHAPEGTAAAVASLRGRVDALAGRGLTGEELQEELAQTFGAEDELSGAERALMERLGLSVALGTAAGLTKGVLGVVGNDALMGRGVVGVGRLGAAFGVLSSGLGALGSTGTGHDDLSLAGGAVDALSLVRSLGAKGNLAVGTVFSLVDASMYLSEGELGAAGVALLPVLGAVVGGALGGFFGLGAGAVPGAAAGTAVGGLLNAGLGALGVGEVDAFKKHAIPAIADALIGGGMDAELAQEFAERFGADDEFGGQFAHLADHLGLTTPELMNQLAECDPGYRSWFLEQTSGSIDLQAAADGTETAQDSRSHRRFMYSVDTVSPSQTGEEGASARFKQAWLRDGRML